jgi:hypothetical protein
VDQSPKTPPLPAGLTPIQLAGLLKNWIDGAIAYSRRKRKGFQAASSLIKLGTVMLSAASTIILGIQDLDFWTGLGFALVALATVAGAIEPFFNWRSRWVLMEEQLHRFFRLREDLIMRVATTGEGELTHDDVRRLYDEYSEIWVSTSQRWLEYRRSPEHG